MSFPSSEGAWWYAGHAILFQQRAPVTSFRAGVELLLSGSAHEHEQTPPRMACYLIRMPEFVSDIFGAVNEKKTKQQLQQQPATAEATAVGAVMSA